MREYENVLNGYLCVVTTVFSHHDGIYGFIFPKKFLEISCRDLTSSLTSASLLLIKKPVYQSIDQLSLCICMAQCQQSSPTLSHVALAVAVAVGVMEVLVVAGLAQQ